MDKILNKYKLEKHIQKFPEKVLLPIFSPVLH